MRKQKVYTDEFMSQNIVKRAYITLIYRVWCFVDTLELKVRQHGQRIGAIRKW